MAELDSLEAGIANNANSEKANQKNSPFTRSWREHPGGYPMIAERIALKTADGHLSPIRRPQCPTFTLSSSRAFYPGKEAA